MRSDVHHLPGEDAVFPAGDILVNEHAFVAMEDGFGDISHSLAIGQQYIVMVSAPRQETGRKEPWQKFGQLARTEAMGETGVRRGRIFFNAHNHLCCV
jgi:hypothetical protein